MNTDTNSHLMLVDPCPETPGNIRLAVTDGEATPQSWRSLDPAIALLQVRAFMANMEDGDGVVHSVSLPPAFLEALEPAGNQSAAR